MMLAVLEHWWTRPLSQGGEISPRGLSETYCKGDTVKNFGWCYWGLSPFITSCWLTHHKKSKHGIFYFIFFSEKWDFLFFIFIFVFFFMEYFNLLQGICTQTVKGMKILTSLDFSEVVHQSILGKLILAYLLILTCVDKYPMFFFSNGKRIIVSGS